MLGREITVSGTNPERLCVLYIHRNREAKRFLEGGPPETMQENLSHQYPPPWAPQGGLYVLQGSRHLGQSIREIKWSKKVQLWVKW
jgi:hypothetical protein